MRYDWLYPNFTAAIYSLTVHPKLSIMFDSKKIVLLPILLLLSMQALTQPLLMRSLSMDDGLSQGYITTLYQDSRGFIWMGTFFGLNRYDGYTIKTYTPNHLDRWSLHANKINCLTEDRNGLLWVGTENGVAIVDSYTDRIVHLNALIDEIPAHDTRKIIIDGRGDIWFYQEKTGSTLLYYLQADASFLAAVRGKGSLSKSVTHKRISLPSTLRAPFISFIQQTADEVVIVDRSGTAYRLLLDSRKIQASTLDDNSRLLPDGGRYLPSEIRNGTLLMPGQAANTTMPLENISEVHKLPDGRKLLFRFYDNNIYIFDDQQLANGTSRLDALPVLHTIDQPSSFARLIDRNGDIWIGTIGYGVRKISTRTSGYTRHADDVSFYNFVQLPDQQLWTGYLHHDKVVDLSTHKLQQLPWRQQLPDQCQLMAMLYSQRQQAVYQLVRLIDEQKLAFYKYDPKGRQVTYIPLPLEVCTPSPPLIMEDRSGMLWISNQKGEIVRYNPGSGQAERWDYSHLFPAELVHQLIVRCIIQDTFGNLWLGDGYGLVKISFRNGQPHFKAYHNYNRAGTLFKNNGIFAIQQDPNNANELWLGTLGGGLALFDTHKETVTYYPNGDTSNSEVVLGMITDSHNNLWLSTSRGIWCFSTSRRRFINYDAQGSLLEPAYNASGYGRLPDGRLLFGAMNGLYVLQPSLLLEKGPFASLNTIQITRFGVNNEDIQYLVDEDKIDFQPGNTIKLTLRHRENNLSISFAVPYAKNPDLLHYHYKVSGLHDDWIGIGKQRTINLAALAPGRYNIELQVASPEPDKGSHPITRLEVWIKPPWYFSQVAYILYALLLTAVVLAVIRYDRKRLEMQHEAELSIQEMKRLQSLSNFKNKFFAYIAHEFKTPLTIILGISDTLRQRVRSEESMQMLDLVRYEGDNLLRLIDEMVDVTKLQDKTIVLNYQYGDLTSFIQSLTDSYMPLAYSRKIRLMFRNQGGNIFMNFDQQRTRYILSNLINNAFQHTPANGEIVVRLEQYSDQAVKIQVEDSGEGISQQDLPFIFDKYYQSSSTAKSPSTFGLGLSFVKDLLDFMGGSIAAESSMGKGSVFSLVLPAKSQIPTAPLSMHQPLPADLPLYTEEQLPVHEDAPSLLIVEDNPALLAFLKKILAPHFNLLTATDGQEGMKKACMEIPDIILTDVVMPLVDGIEMTQKIKTHPLTSHIPVVMLSARADIGDKLKGQQVGADAYLSKPFNTQELINSLNNLYKLQQRWKERYQLLAETSSPDLSMASQPAEIPFQQSSIDSTDEFMQSLLSIFEQHYTYEDFDVQQLCKIMLISKTQLYRKLATVSDKSAMELLRDYRLNKAAELIVKYPEMSTKEVAYKVGFRERTHFSTLFTKKFNQTPTQMRKQLR